MKKAAPILIILLLVAVALVWMRISPCCTRPPSPETPALVAKAPTPQPELAIATQPTSEPKTPEGQPPAARVEEVVSVEETQRTETTEVPSDEMPELSPEQALETLKVMFVNYGQRFKGNPVGNNAEITAALDGDNPQGVHFLDPARDHMNDKGELVDGWGTPYFFHQLGGYDMEIHSAGPDRKMWTQDDLVTR